MNSEELVVSQNSDTVQSTHVDTPANKRGLSTGDIIGFFLLVIVTSLSQLLIYHHYFAKSSAVATVDISAIVKVREQQFTALVSRANATDADRQAAYAMVSNIGPEIEQAIARIQKECACTLLVKSAVLAGNTQDYTNVIKEQLGMKGAD